MLKLPALYLVFLVKIWLNYLLIILIVSLKQLLNITCFYVKYTIAPFHSSHVLLNSPNLAVIWPDNKMTELFLP